MVRGAAITIRIPGEAGFQGAPGCLARDWIFVHTPGLPLASFAVSRDFLVLGEQCLTRRARSREGCSVPFLSPFALFAASRVSLRYREGITSHAKSTKSRRMYFLLTIGTLRASRVIFQYRERTMSHAKGANERGNVSDRTAKEGPRTLRRGRPAALVVARSRFELLSQGPEPCMIDRYTTGLFGSKMLFVGPN